MAESNNITAAEAKRAARNAGALAVASIISKAALFGWQIILAPWLGVADYGVYGTVGALFAIAAALPNFGMGPIVIRDVARAPKLAGKYLTATLYMQTVLALLAYVGVNIAAAAMDSSEAVRAFTAVAGLSLLIDILGNMCFDILLARERMVTTSAIEIGHILLRIGLGWLLLVAGFGLFGVYVATLLTGLGRSLLLWFLLWRDGVRPEWPLDKIVAKALFFNGLPLALSAFLTLAFQQIDKLMSTSLIGEVGTGYLTAAFVIIFGVVNLMSTTILTAIFPLMSRVYGDGKNPLFGFMVEKLTIFTFIINIPLVILITVFSQDIVLLIFGEDFLPTANIISILMLYALLNMMVGVFSQVLLIENRQKLIFLTRTLSIFINIGLNYLFLIHIGVVGAAIA
ncbi:MAG: flippase, partial [Chloroflexi bacterium]